MPGRTLGGSGMAVLCQRQHKRCFPQCQNGFCAMLYIFSPLTGTDGSMGSHRSNLRDIRFACCPCDASADRKSGIQERPVTILAVAGPKFFEGLIRWSAGHQDTGEFRAENVARVEAW